MRRPIWKGTISFGLVTIPVTLESAETSFDLHFRLMDNRNKAGIRYERVNEVTGEEVPWSSIVKGYEFSKDNYVLLDEEDFKHADVRAFETVEIEDFVSRDEVDMVYFEKPYYLVPQKSGQKGYVLLREVLRDSNKMGIARVVIRTRQYIAAIFPYEKALVVHLLRYRQEVRDPADLDLPEGNLKSYRISEREIEMGKQLIDSMTTKWKPEKYHDEYRENLMKWIQKKAKAHGKPVHFEDPVEEKAPEKGVDMLELLRQSVKGHVDGHHNGKLAHHR